MALIYEQEEKNGTPYLVLTGSDTPVRRLVVPKEVDGVAVRVIGNHAFASRKELEEVVLPDSIDTMRGFCFHDCASLKRLTLCDSVVDFYDGCIKLCDALRDIVINVNEGNYRVLRSLLNDNGELLRVRLLMPDAEALLTFPDYVTVATDNTMARTIQFDISGAGLAYRECVTRESVNYNEYDSMFNRVVIDDISSCTDLVTGRLRFPHMLSEVAENTYKDWLFKNSAAVLSLLVRNEDTDKIRFLTNAELVDDAAVPLAIEEAARLKRTAVAALLTEHMRKRGTVKGPEVLEI